MKLLIEQYVENRLKQAQYEFDGDLKVWVGWIDNVKGVFSQARTLEGVRGELAEILEEHLLLSIYKGKKPSVLGSEFKDFYAKAAVYTRIGP
ncbi:MAG: hypothetical protein HY225_02620 [Candidatus Vogelbacteria bacterium]|nr:hypothetical protein [Candidatus Vogelbacteria bacterium]